MEKINKKIGRILIGLSLILILLILICILNKSSKNEFEKEYVFEDCDSSIRYLEKDSMIYDAKVIKYKFGGVDSRNLNQKPDGCCAPPYDSPL